MKKIFAIFLMFCAASMICGHRIFAVDTETISKFVAAENAYKDGEFAKAIDNYETVLKTGKASGNIYYNLGNAYFKDGKLGRAILSYRRALNLLPRDSDLRYNYQYALSKASISQSVNEGFLEKILEKHIEFYSLDEMMVVITLVFVAMIFLSLFAVYKRWDKTRNFQIFAVLGIIFLIYVMGAVIKIDQEKNCAIMTTSGSAFYEPTEKATAYFSLLEGDEVKLLSKEAGWYKIKGPDGKLGWVSSKFLEKI